MIQIYHYNKCGKSRGALCLLENKNAKFSVRYYIDNPLNVKELKALHKKLNVPLIEMVRTNETVYKKLFADKTPTDKQLLEAIAEHPILLQRPIVETNESAIIARPPEKVLDFIN